MSPTGYGGGCHYCTVLDLFPTLISLARAYSLLDGDGNAQEEMVRRQSNNVINAVAIGTFFNSFGAGIFQFVWIFGCQSTNQ
ncbi:hypothetical protein D0Y65_009686, partial [Glycine soja]